MTNMGDTGKSRKDRAVRSNSIPITVEERISATHVQARLDAGEPTATAALTIIDIRDDKSFNEERIRGAISFPIEVLAEQASQALSLNQDIYIYAGTDETAVDAVSQMRLAGFKRVSTLKGGLLAWKAIGGRTERGKSESDHLGSDTCQESEIENC